MSECERAAMGRIAHSVGTVGRKKKRRPFRQRSSSKGPTLHNGDGRPIQISNFPGSLGDDRC